MSSSLNIQHCQIIALNGCLLILPASFLSSHRKFNIQYLTFNIKLNESKLEIRHQFRHHCSHRRSQLLLHAELQVIFLVFPQISQICTDTLVASNGLIHINSHSKENL